MTPAGAAIFANLPVAARAQVTALWKHESDGFMYAGPCDPQSCIRFGLLPAYAFFSYAVRAVSPYAPGAPAGPEPSWMPKLKEAQIFMRLGGLLIDVRTEEEYDAFHFDEAILVPTPPPPLDALEIGELRDALLEVVCRPNLSFSHPIVTYCRKGVRAGIAAALLREAGFINTTCAGGVETMPLRALIECDVQLC